MILTTHISNIAEPLFDIPERLRLGYVIYKHYALEEE